MFPCHVPLALMVSILFTHTQIHAYIYICIHFSLSLLIYEYKYGSLLDSTYSNVRADRANFDTVASATCIRILAQNSEFWRPENSILPPPSLNEAYDYVFTCQSIIACSTVSFKDL